MTIREDPKHDCIVSRYAYCGEQDNYGIYIITCDICERYLGIVNIWYPRDIEFTRKLKATRYPKGNSAIFSEEIQKKYS